MTRTDIPTKDYLGEMKRCSKCKRLKDKSKFSKCGSGLQCHCKKCHTTEVQAYRQKEKEKRLAKEKTEKAKQAVFRKEALRQPSFIYQNGYTLKVIPIYENFKIELCAGQEEMAVLLPNDRMELFKDWLNVKLKEKE